MKLKYIKFLRFSVWPIARYQSGAPAYALKKTSEAFIEHVYTDIK